MAISKERLEELIKQETTIYCAIPYGVDNIKLTKLCRIYDWGNELCLSVEDTNYCSLSILYENKEDAEFVAKYHTSRIERFKPPIYEDIKDGQPYRFNFTSNGKHYNFFVSVLLIELLYVCEEEICNEQIICQHSTKENYIKAVERARKLFKGEKDA